MPVVSPEMEPIESRLPDDLSGAIIGRFHVLQRLGGGGMGEVYAAEDTTLKRLVALKRVAAHLRADPTQVNRMFKEAERASALNHPCVAAVYDISQDHGELFLVMEYVEGVSLRQRFRKKCSLEEIVSVGAQCAEALQAAHEKGVVHGDVKPENIMLTAAGGVKLLDFGVARRIISDVHNDETTTVISGWAGTPGYMAPEALLEKLADGRSDLFSLGVVLYEGITGVHPFKADSAMAIADRTLHDDPPPLPPLNSSAAAPLAGVVRRLIAKDPNQRYANAADAARDLRAYAVVLERALELEHAAKRPARLRTFALIAAIVLIAAAIMYRVIPGRSHPGSDSKAANRPAAQIQPVKSETANTAAYQDYVRGESYREKEAPDDIENAITAYRRALDRDPGYTLAYAGLGMAYLKKFSNTGAPAWLEPARQNCEHSVALDADSAAGRACVGLIHNARGEYAQAMDEFQRALQADGNNDVAYGGLGFAYSHLRKLDLAEQNYKRAVEVRPKYWETHTGLGSFYVSIGRYSDAAAEFKQAVAVGAGLSTPYLKLGGADILLGDYDAAIVALKKGIAIRPTLQQYSNLGSAYLNLRRFDEAIASFEQASRMSGTDFVSLGNLARAYYWAPGKRQQATDLYAAAIRLAQDALGVNPNNADAYLMLANYHAMLGHKPEALRNLQKAKALNSEGAELWFFTAVVENQFGDKAAALKSLEHSLALGYSRSEVRAAVEFDNLHAAPQFQALVRPH
jgi:eukaryotic-like serine/threonine-protein kinase